MTLEEAKKKISKLLRLSTSSNQHEAERAASKAAEIMHKYQIEEASLCNVEEDEEEETGIHDFMIDQEGVKKKVHWQMQLAWGCALVCNCKVYWEMWPSPRIKIIGRKSDVDSARYLFDMIARQVEEAVNLSYYKKGVYGVEDKKSWQHAFRLGCATEIRSRLHKDWWNRMEKMRAVDGESRALVVLDKRLERTNQLYESLGLKKGRGASITNERGYREGVEKGKSVRIGGRAKGALGAVKRELST